MLFNYFLLTVAITYFLMKQVEYMKFLIIYINDLLISHLIIVIKKHQVSGKYYNFLFSFCLILIFIIKNHLLLL